MNLQNSEGQSVGEIKDIVLDAKSGKVRYAAVTYGGFLGVGNKMFAVPFGAFKVRQNPDDPADAGDYVMVLDVTQAQLKERSDSTKTTGRTWRTRVSFAIFTSGMVSRSMFTVETLMSM